ncbi:MAG: hypothetical protein KKH98_08955 [Spirochaetes bacterium]|nr:hypothetical protein [Spirochaetota bacterium]
MKVLKGILLCLIFLLTELTITAVYAKKVAVLQYYKGDVLIERHVMKGKWMKPRLNVKLDDKDQIKLVKGGIAKLKFIDGSIVEIKESKIYQVGDVKNLATSKRTKGKSVLSKLKSLKSKLGKGGGADKGGPTAVAGVRGADVSEKSKSPVKPSELVWEE